MPRRREVTSAARPSQLAGVITAVLRHPAVMRVKHALRDLAWRARGPARANPSLPAGARSILFVCLGNICRSPFAALVAERYIIETGRTLRVESAGIRTTQAAAPPEEAHVVSAEYGLSLEGHRPTPLTAELMEAYDVVVVMEYAQLEQLHTLYPALHARVVLLPLFDDRTGPGYERHNITDPFGQGLGAFRHCYGRIDHATRRLLGSLGRPGEPA